MLNGIFSILLNFCEIIHILFSESNNNFAFIRKMKGQENSITPSRYR